MREQVCIVLNERESNKAKAADALSARLRDLDITASRIPVTENLESVLKQRLPRVIVVDYLLGDFSTGLDILTASNRIDPERRPAVIFLTDEPSIHVAVEALRNGALHFVELDDAQAIPKVCEEIRSYLASAPRTAAPLPASYPAVDDLILASAKAQKLLSVLKETAAKRSPISVVLGNPGSGVSTVASALRGLQAAEGFTRSIDLKLFTGDLLEIAGLRPAREELRLGNNFSLILENAQEDTGEFLEALAHAAERLWPQTHRTENSSFLIACTNDAQTAAAWQRSAGAELIQVPALADRKEDMAAFVQRFLRQAEELTTRRVKPFPAEVIAWLSSLPWPGELTQLRSIVIDAGIAVSLGEENVRAALDDRLERWLECNTLASRITLEPLEAAATLERCEYRYQTAAARLGCSVKALYQLLHPENAGTTRKP